MGLFHVKYIPLVLRPIAYLCHFSFINTYVLFCLLGGFVVVSGYWLPRLNRTSYPILPYPTLSYPILPYPTLSYLILPYPTLTYLILPYPTLSYLILPYPTLSHPILPCPTLSYLILPYPTLSYPVLPYPTLSYPVLPCPTLTPYFYVYVCVYFTLLSASVSDIDLDNLTLSVVYVHMYVHMYVLMYVQSNSVIIWISEYSRMTSTHCSVPTSCNSMENDLDSKYF